MPRCISYLSYIKPQPSLINLFGMSVVYHIFPTSNRNQQSSRLNLFCVVYHIFPTSNRNYKSLVGIYLVLYIISFLHQTATLNAWKDKPTSCISYLSYIKPQHLP